MPGPALTRKCPLMGSPAPVIHGAVFKLLKPAHGGEGFHLYIMSYSIGVSNSRAAFSRSSVWPSAHISLTATASGSCRGPPGRRVPADGAAHLVDGKVAALVRDPGGKHRQPPASHQRRRAANISPCSPPGRPPTPKPSAPARGSGASSGSDVRLHAPGTSRSTKTAAWAIEPHGRLVCGAAQKRHQPRIAEHRGLRGSRCWKTH